MPPIETDGLHQKAMLWRVMGVDAYGQPTHEPTPEEISVRWRYTDRHESTAFGSGIKLDATAYVDQQIPIDSLMWLGNECEWEDNYYGTGSGSAAEVEFKSDNRLYVVKTYKETPDIKCFEVRRECGLVRFKHDVVTP
jgi:hypothetical protein